jgi:hypothetical protein
VGISGDNLKLGFFAALRMTSMSWLGQSADKKDERTGYALRRSAATDRRCSCDKDYFDPSAFTRRSSSRVMLSALSVSGNVTGGPTVTRM